MSKPEFFFIFTNNQQPTTNNQQPTTNMSIFTKIITGEIPSYKVAEDSNFIAF
ncbi:MAG: hypothetical protein ACI9Q3_001328, partial [Maribacter sp.]